MEPKESKPIVEQREETMVCVTGGKPTLRTARFLHPCVSSVDEAMAVPLVPPLISQLMSTKSAGTWPLKVQFQGWRGTQPKWKLWVDKMVQIHEPIWRKTCIYDAIMASTYKVGKNENLVFGLVELWSPETNTFVFPWGEATITLEDVLILGGFSVLGEPVTSPLNDKLLKINERLTKERFGFFKRKAGKARYGAWITYFMEKKHIDGNLEHVAFLALWLSRYVFPAQSQNLVGKHVFPIAAHLSQGTRIALAPAVLSSLYRDLGLLNRSVVVSNDSCDVWALFHILELWAWEHFPMLSPKRINLLGKGEPRVARWDALSTSLELRFVRSVLKSPENFQWRCYATNVINWRHPSFYNEKEMWVVYDSNIDDELRSFAHCLRASELVGLNCIEQYLPHRVAMQFGLDQDLPGYLTRANSRWKDAWKAYYKSIKNATFYIPPRLSESNVTTRYLEWWKQCYKETANTLLHKNKRGMGCKGLENEEKEESHHSGPPGFPPRSKKHKLQEVKLENWSDDDIDPPSMSKKHKWQEVKLENWSDDDIDNLQSLKLLSNSTTKVANLPFTWGKRSSRSARSRTSLPSTIVSNPPETKSMSSTGAVEKNASTKGDRTGDSTQNALGIGEETLTSRTDQDTELENRVLKLEKEFARLKARMMAKVQMKRRTPG